MNKPYYLALDGLRGILVLAVYLFHYYVSPFTKNWHMAVDVFFILSGFLVTRSYQNITGNFVSKSKTFLKKRFFRIYPIYFISVVAISCLKDSHLGSIISQLTFTFGFFMYDPAYLPNAVTWSLFNEEFFYLLFPLIIYRIGFFSSFIFLVLSWYLRKKMFGYSNLFETHTGDPYYLARTPLTNMYFFAAGIFLYYFVERFRHQYFKHMMMMLLLGGLALALNDHELKFLWLSYFTILYCLMSDRYNVFKFSPLVWMGKHCYFIYLFQFIPRDTLLHLGVVNHSYLGIINFLILIVLAGLSMSFIERPILEKYT